MHRTQPAPVSQLLCSKPLYFMGACACASAHAKCTQNTHSRAAQIPRALSPPAVQCGYTRERPWEGGERRARRARASLPDHAPKACLLGASGPEICDPETTPGCAFRVSRKQFKDNYLIFISFKCVCFFQTPVATSCIFILSQRQNCARREKGGGVGWWAERESVCEKER